jgi:hypothetical protein
MHSYYDSLGFEENHPGEMFNCTNKKCVRERKFWRSIPEIDPWNDGPDPWMELSSKCM